MRCLVWDGSRVGVVERPEPGADADTAVVRVSIAGICNTDLEIVKGYLGFRGILGHEFAGVVEEGPAPWRGERVVGEINFACHACATCASGLPRHCPRRSVMGIQGADGAFAEQLAIPVANLHRVPDGISDEAAVFTEPLAAAFEILEQVPIGPGQECVVLGDGKLGLLTAQTLRRTGAHVRVVGRHPAKLALLKTRNIETCTLDAWRPAATADVVVEATGNPDGLPRALEALRPRGTLVLKSTLAERSRVDLAPLVIHEIQVIGSRCGPFPPALAALESGDVETSPLVSERFSLAHADRALRRASEPGVLKVLIDCA